MTDTPVYLDDEIARINTQLAAIGVRVGAAETANATLTAAKAALLAQVSSQALIISQRDERIAELMAQIAAGGGGVTPAVVRFVGQNLAAEDVSRDAFGAVVLDKSKTSDPWSSPGSGLVLDATGFPNNVPAGSYNETLWNVESTVTRPGITADQNIHVIESNCNISPNPEECENGTYLSDTTDSSGVRRVEFRLNVPQLALADHANSIRVFMHGPIPSSGKFARMFHKLDEAEVRTGAVWRSQFIDRVKGYSPLRFMDWAGTKTGFGNGQTDFAQYRSKDFVTWAGQVPLEHQIGLCNVTGSDGHFIIPHAYTDQAIRDMMAKFIASQGGLAAGLKADLENSNEVWDPGSQQYGHYSNPGWPQVAGSNDPSWAAYGYRSAQMMAIAMKAVGYDPRFRPYLGYQTKYGSQFEGVLLGVKAAIAEWSDPTSTPRDLVINGNVVGRRGYSAEFAARFKVPGQLFKNGGGAVYLGAGMARTGWPQQDKDKFLTWCRATDDSGLTAFFHQLRTGLEMNDPFGFNIAAWQTTFAPQYAIHVREQIRWKPYEGCICVEDFNGEMDAEMIAFRTRAMHDPRMIQLTADWMAQNALAGCDVVENLCELSGPGGAYGSRENPFDETYPRDVGLLQVNANPPAPLQLKASVVRDGATATGVNVKYTITVEGGRGLIAVELVSAAPEQSLEFRTISGVLATAGDYPIRLKVTDETGSAPIYVDIPQTVTVPAGIAASRYWRFTVEKPLYGDRVGISELRAKDADGDTIAPAGWVATAPGVSWGDNPPSRLVDGSTANSFINQDGPTYPVDVFIDTVTPIKPASWEVCQCAEIQYFSPFGIVIAARDDAGTYNKVADHPSSAGWDYSPGFVNIPLDYSGTVE